jgi:hypothetical protein
MRKIKTLLKDECLQLDDEHLKSKSNLSVKHSTSMSLVDDNDDINDRRESIVDLRKISLLKPKTNLKVESIVTLME